MAILYPGEYDPSSVQLPLDAAVTTLDNQNRANRVNQLASDIAQLQTQVKETVADAKTQDERAVKILEKIAQERGYKTLDDYIAEVEKQLSPEDQQKYQDMKKELDNKDEVIDLSTTVATGIAGIGFASGLAAIAVSALFICNLITVSLQAIGIGLVKVISGGSSCWKTTQYSGPLLRLATVQF
ncbi:hypothetical protein AX17_007069 [Amanita inopinata Kibby_2008]|nr:hypothetical protein AX17_007069 [Amanita inopinata Kibby_2008]